MYAPNRWIWTIGLMYWRKKKKKNRKTPLVRVCSSVLQTPSSRRFVRLLAETKRSCWPQHARAGMVNAVRKPCSGTTKAARMGKSIRNKWTRISNIILRRYQNSVGVAVISFNTAAWLAADAAGLASAARKYWKLTIACICVLRGDGTVLLSPWYILQFHPLGRWTVERTSKRYSPASGHESWKLRRSKSLFVLLAALRQFSNPDNG